MVSISAWLIVFPVVFWIKAFKEYGWIRKFISSVKEKGKLYQLVIAQTGLFISFLLVALIFFASSVT